MPQKPVRRALEKNPEQVRRWLEEEYPEIRKQAKREKAEIHWGDEMGLRSDHAAGRGGGDGVEAGHGAPLAAGDLRA